MTDFNNVCGERFKDDPTKQTACVAELTKKCGNLPTDAEQQKCANGEFLKAGVSTYTGYSYGVPLGKGDGVQRLRQDVFAMIGFKGFHANNYTFLQADSSGGAARSLYGETNFWLGHDAIPVGLSYQSMFASSGNDKGWLGLYVGVSDLPYIKSACDAVGLFSYAQLHPMGIEWRRYSFLPGSEIDKQSLAGLLSLRAQ